MKTRVTNQIWNYSDTWHYRLLASKTMLSCHYSQNFKLLRFLNYAYLAFMVVDGFKWIIMMMMTLIIEVSLSLLCSIVSRVK